MNSDKHRRAARRYRNLRPDMLLSEDPPLRRQPRPDPTVYEPHHTFEEFDR